MTSKLQYTVQDLLNEWEESIRQSSNRAGQFYGDAELDLETWTTKETLKSCVQQLRSILHNSSATEES